MITIRKNIIFYSLLGILILLFVASIVWLKIVRGEKNKMEKQLVERKVELESLKSYVPTKEHEVKLDEEKEQIQQEYEKIKEKVLRWFDVISSVEAETRPHIFLGDLQTLASKIRDYAQKQGIPLSDKARFIGYEEYLREGIPPVADADFIQLQKERSAIRDIMALLIHNEVEGIEEIVRLSPATAGPTTGGASGYMGGATQTSSLYKTIPFLVKFYCTYPALANFQKSLVSPTKVPTPLGTVPNNYLIIQELSYVAVSALEEQEAEMAKKAAMSAAERSSTSSTTTRGSMRPPTGSMSRGTRSTSPSIRDWSPYIPLSRQGRTTYSTGSMRTARESRKKKEEKPMIGRYPQYNLLTVTMKIDMIDFNSELTGIEEQKKTETGKVGPSMSVGR